MRREPWFVLVLLAACSTDGHPDPVDEVVLTIDVQLSDTSLAMFAREPDRPCQCSFGWTELGTCRTQSDAIGCDCDPWPASCLETVAVLGGGESLATASWDPSWWGVALGFDADAADELVIAGCGSEVSIALEPAPRPDTAVAIDETGVATWSSEPLGATSLVMLGDGYAAESCHREGGEGTMRVPLDEGDRILSVTALTTPRVRGTDIGTVRIWSGNTAELSAP
jgi:hypothetical protein